MRMVDIIEKKRDGGTLSKEEIEFVITGFTNGTIPDYQMSAFAMAIYFQDMNDEEITHLTLAMANSGDILDLSSIKGVKVDKHSTGGVGDTTTLILAPLVASVGVPVAKMSGRGLGFTGGTLDKFEAIPGFSVEMTEERFIQSVNEIGVAVIGQTSDLAPADKLLYALRDVTGTVNAIPLIASSIMSKKIASGADAIVLDVTMGEGAFMKNEADVNRLAQTMVSIGHLSGRTTMAVISDMSQPLGYAIGNALEVMEAIDALHGRGPADLMELTYTLGAQMLVLAGLASTTSAAKKLLESAIESGAAFEKFREMVQNQGGDLRFIDSPELLDTAKFQIPVLANTSGFVRAIPANTIGLAAMRLGAGRATKMDIIEPGVGILLHKKVGDAVKVGEPLLTLYSNTKEVTEISDLLTQAISIGGLATEEQLIHGIIE